VKEYAPANQRQAPNHSLNLIHCSMWPKARHFILGLWPHTATVRVSQSLSSLMINPVSHTATPQKRIAAFAFDSVAVLLSYLVAVALAESSSIDIGTFRVFVLVAAIYHLAFLLLRDGRTLGKQAQDICVISASGSRVTYLQALARVSIRYLPLALVTIQYDAWAIGPSIAGFSAKLLAGILWLRELHLLQNSLSRETFADKMAQTIVVNTPTAEPHWAPAVPMFSASDAEFGNPPKRPKDTPRK